jgi:hypothetical protein
MCATLPLLLTQLARWKRQAAAPQIDPVGLSSQINAFRQFVPHGLSIAAGCNQTRVSKHLQVMRQQILGQLQMLVDFLHVARSGAQNLKHGQPRRIGEHRQLGCADVDAWIEFHFSNRYGRTFLNYNSS